MLGIKIDIPPGLTDFWSATVGQIQNSLVQGYIFLPKVDFFPNQVKLKVDFFPPFFSREVGGVRGGAPTAGGSAPQAKIFLRIG